MKFLILYSYRNLWRTPQRTWPMIIALGLGVCFISLNMNFSRSGIDETRKDFLKHFTGEYTVTNSDYYDEEDKKKFDKYKVINDAMVSNQELLNSSSPRITNSIYISGNSLTLGSLMIGIDPVVERRFSTIHSSLMTGKFLSDGPANEIVLGAKLARKIGVEVGQEVGLIGQANDGSVANEMMKLVGILDLGGGDLESALSLVHLKDAQKILVMDDNYHQRILFSDRGKSIPSNLSVTSWDKILPEVAASMRFSIGFLWLISIMVALLVSVGLGNSFMITFLQREKEFQTLQVIGTNSLWVVTSLLIEGIILVGFGLVIGLILGSLFTWYFHMFPLDMQFLNGGKPLLLGGMKIQPKVRISIFPDPFWQIPLLVLSFFGLSMIHPLLRVINKNRTRFS